MTQSKLDITEMNMITKRSLLVAALTLIPLAVAAHGPKIGAHGGRQTAAGGFHVEIVAKDALLTVYLLDHFTKAVATSGFEGVAMPAVGDVQRIPLAPDGDNRLKGALPAATASEFRGSVLIITPTGGKTLARFD
jgi:hypothetical protein